MRPWVINSRMAAPCIQSTMRRCTEASDERRLSRRGGKGTPRASDPAFALTFSPFLPHQEAKAEHHQDGVAMEAVPQPTLILVPAQLPFRFFVILLDPMPAMGVFDHLLQRGMGPAVAPIVFRIAGC